MKPETDWKAEVIQAFKRNASRTTFLGGIAVDTSRVAVSKEAADRSMAELRRRLDLAEKAATQGR